jgi:hypothetical protein
MTLEEEMLNSREGNKKTLKYAEFENHNLDPPEHSRNSFLGT